MRNFVTNQVFPAFLVVLVFRVVLGFLAKFHLFENNIVHVNFKLSTNDNNLFLTLFTHQVFLVFRVVLEFPANFHL